MTKLYVVVRSDLLPGLQIAQAGHALVSFQHSYSAEYEEWYRTSNNLVVLEVSSESELMKLTESLTRRGIKTCQFHEPDLGDALTAICVEPAGGKSLSTLPLALRRAPQECAHEVQGTY